MNEMPFVWKKGTKPKDPNECREAEKFVSSVLEQDKKKYDQEGYAHEKEMNERHALFFETALVLLRTEFKENGLDFPEEVTLARMHVFDREGYIKEFGTDYEANGGHHGVSGQICVVEHEMNSRFFMSVVHELIHAVSVQKYLIDYENAELKLYRSGYSVSKYAESGEQSVRLHAFNEAMVELTRVFLTNECQDVIRKRLGFTDDEIEYMLRSGSYRSAVILTDLILAKLTKEKGFGMTDKFKRAQFTGDLIHLRTIDNVFGKGALKKLDSFIARPNTDAERQKNEEILEYFRSRK